MGCVACPPINPGWYYDIKQNIMKFSQNIADSDIDASDVRTTRILNQIANTLENDIQLTFDAPSLHPDGKMPVLDMKIWVEENRIKYTFYNKEVASKFTIMKRSAIPDSTKKHTCFMEALSPQQIKAALE